MEVVDGLFPKLLAGTFVVVFFAFVTRGFGQLLFGADLAQLLAAPLFAVGIAMAVLAFVLSVLVWVGVLERQAID